MAGTIKITLQDTPVQISAQVDDGAALVAQVKETLATQSGVVDFTDVKKNQYVISGAKIAAVEVSAEENHKVGFIN